jgi:hypothetical protein
MKKLKHVILVLLLSIAFVSCSKSDPIPTPVPDNSYMGIYHCIINSNQSDGNGTLDFEIDKSGQIKNASCFTHKYLSNGTLYYYGFSLSGTLQSSGSIYLRVNLNGSLNTDEYEFYGNITGKNKASGTCVDKTHKWYNSTFKTP